MDDWDDLVGAIEALISKGDAMTKRIDELEAKLAKVEDDVLTSVGEALAGMSHEHASPYTRLKIGEAIDRVFTGL